MLAPPPHPQLPGYTIIGSGHTGDIFLDNSVLTKLILISCVQAKKLVYWRKSLLQDKKNKKNRPGGGAQGRRPQAGKKKHKKPRTIHRQIFRTSLGDSKRYTII